MERNQDMASSSSSSNANNIHNPGHEPEGVDYMSLLPMEVVAHIFSFLPLKYWILMCLVSKRWKYLWTQIQNLELNESAIVQNILKEDIWCSLCDEFHKYNAADHGCHRHLKKAATKKFFSVVDRILLLHSGCTITRFHLFIDYNSLKGDTSRIDPWVDFAMNSNIESLELNFSGGRIVSTVVRANHLNLYALYQFKAPDCFAPEILKDLTLISCIYEPDVFLFFKSLRRLTLVDSDLSGGPIEELLFACPHLETLNFTRCLFPEGFMQCEEELEIKELFLVDCMSYFSAAYPIDIIAPSLVTLKFVTQDLASSRIRNATSLVNAEVAIKSRFPDPSIGYLMDALLIDLSQCQNLDINSWCIQILPPKNSLPSQLSLKCQNLKNLKIKIFMAKQELSGLAYLLSCCPKLETLHLDVSLPLLVDFVHNGQLQNPVAIGEENYWESCPFWFHCLESSLKKVNIRGFTGRDMEMDIVKFLVENTMVLEEMNIGPHKSRTLTSNGERFVYMGFMLRHSFQISRFTKASPHARINISY